ncbi:MAG: Crp/Fnr family transcriptional regulator [Chitinophagaceae bacterium]|nr:MAG: Crp/Fnr family transcriptional regulator [Chitinophagaceae bacterium]
MNTEGSINLLIEKLASINPVSPGLTQFLTEKASVGRWPKNRVLHTEGSIPKHVWFIASGTVRTSIYNSQKAEFQTSWYWFEGEIVCMFQSFFRQIPCEDLLETIEESVLIEYSYTDIMEMFSLFPGEASHLARIITEDYIDRVASFQRDLQRLNAKQRYENLFKKYPELFQKTSLKDIASYLIISQESLSRVRRG